MQTNRIIVVKGTIVSGNPLLGTFRIEGLTATELLAITGNTGPDGMGVPCADGHMHGLTSLGVTTYGKELESGNRLAICMSMTDTPALADIILVLGLRVEVVECEDWSGNHQCEMLLKVDQATLLARLKDVMLDYEGDGIFRLWHVPDPFGDKRLEAEERGVRYMAPLDPNALALVHTGHYRKHGKYIGQ